MEKGIVTRLRPWEVSLDVTHDTEDVHRRLEEDHWASLIQNQKVRWVGGQAKKMNSLKRQLLPH